MTRLQSFIVALTLVACLGVGLLASQRSTSKPPVASHDAFPPLVIAVADETPPPLETSGIIPAVANEPAISPRKLTDDNAAPATDHPVRRTIDRLMPNTSAEERQIWFEELRGLPVNAVEDLLRLRKESNATAPLRTATEPFSSIANEQSDAVPSVLLRYQAVLRHNLLNADTHGYRALRIESVARPVDLANNPENEVSEAFHFAGVRIDTRSGEIEETERPLDVAIRGVGWFVVEDENGKPAFTRHGALQLNDQRELTLPAMPDRRPLSPRITIPEQTPQIFIDSNGAIYGATEEDRWDTEQPIGHIPLARFLDDSALVLHKDGLYRPTAAAGAMSRLKPEKQSNSLQNGALERSNVRREATEQALDRIEKWLRLHAPKTP